MCFSSLQTPCLAYRGALTMIILCIDDDPEDIDLFRDAIQIVDPSINFLSATGGREALLLLASSNGSNCPEFAFLDINMPLMDGKETLKRIREVEHLGSMQVVMLSTGVANWDHSEYKALGANQIMSKASSFHGLCDMLKSILRLES